MNVPIRRLAFVLALMFCALLVSSSYIMTWQADEIRANPANRRTLLETYGRPRGEIIVDGKPVATSVKTDNELKYLRKYSDGPLYAFATGYYSYTYGAGGGVERSENDLLSGTSDRLFYRRATDVLTGHQPRGASIELTLDPDVQKAAYEALGDRKGAVLAMDPKTGAILALVSRPTYDPNLLASHDHASVATAWKELTQAKNRPMTNRAVQGDTYPPGSTFKLVTAAAALRSGQYQPDTSLQAPRTMRLPKTTVDLRNFGGEECNPGSQTATLKQSLEISCNTSFAWLGLQLGGDKIREQARLFGWDAQLNVPMRVTPGHFPAELNEPQTAQSAIGQYDVRSTPMQVLMVAAGIANKGQVMKPYLVKSIRDGDLSLIEQTAPARLSEALNESQAAQLRDMMVAVVENGTGTQAAIGGVRVAGKTGTAEFGTSGAAHAWFTGFAPADDPKIAVVVIIEGVDRGTESTTGGALAAPAAKKVMEAMVNQR